MRVWVGLKWLLRELGQNKKFCSCRYREGRLQGLLDNFTVHRKIFLVKTSSLNLTIRTYKLLHRLLFL